MKKRLILATILQFCFGQLSFCQIDTVSNAKNFAENDSSLFTFIQQNKTSNKFIYPKDSFQFDAINLTNLDTNLIKILNWHKKETERRFKLKKDREYVILILPAIFKYQGVPQSIIDSIYAKNDFPLTDDSPEYIVAVFTEDSDFTPTLKSEWYKYYYYNYKGRDVFVISDLNIQLPNTNEKKSFKKCYNRNRKYKMTQTRYTLNWTGTNQVIYRSF